jgi:hypothetical protein
MASAAQIAANRANSRRSTGPASEAGKAASSQNACKLGLASNTFRVLSVEDQENFDNYVEGLRAEYQPATLMERTLLFKMAQHYWYSQRALIAQDQCFGDNFEPLNQQAAQRFLALMLRYHSTHDRAFHKYRQELEKLQARRKQEPVKQEIATVRLATIKLKHECAAQSNGAARVSKRTTAERQAETSTIPFAA